MCDLHSDLLAVFALQWGHRYEAVDISEWTDFRCWEKALQWGHRYEAVDILD